MFLREGKSKGIYIALIGAMAVAVMSAVFIFNAVANKKDDRQPEVIRIHIRANSNSAEDQRIKYLVRDEIVGVLTPLLAECKTVNEGAAKLKKTLPDLKNAAEGVLRANNLFYGARVDIREEEFPTRIYDGISFPQGVYKALIIELGDGVGDNWWCVAFPPLCFIPAEDDGSGSVKYRSKIIDILNGYFGG